MAGYKPQVAGDGRTGRVRPEAGEGAGVALRLEALPAVRPEAGSWPRSTHRGLAATVGYHLQHRVLLTGVDTGQVVE